MSKTQRPAASATVQEISDASPAPAAPQEVGAQEGETVRVRAVYGDTYHLLTGELIPQHSDKKITLDPFALAQIEAGKWELVD